MHDVSLAEGLSVSQRQEDNRVTLIVRMKSASDCILHWGLNRRPGAVWQRPPDASWPPGTAPGNANAVDSPLAAKGPGEREVAIQLDVPCPWKNLPFVLYFPKEKRWLKNGGGDFCIPLPHGHGNVPTPEAALEAWVPHTETSRRVFTLDGGEQLAVTTSLTDDTVRVTLVCDAELPLIMHWGVAWQFRHEWQLPPEDLRPAGTVAFDQMAVRTPFVERDGLGYLELEFHRPGPRGLKFVLYQPEGNAWLKHRGTDLYLPLFEDKADPRLSSPELWDLAERIVGAEKGSGSWTLMHRYNLCHDLLDQAKDEETLALLYAWLRFSAIRQLDWQRRFNTKPRELSHAQERLTARLASLWRSAPAGSGSCLWARLMLTTLGRGGDGQRVRDEILHIMHRNHLKESSGTFVEEWHQKLHNNTTPDDVVICQAYLAFLSSNGNLGRFYETLEQGGVTRERLAGFERPIKTEPQFHADKKDALIPEFEGFLRILRSVHAGTDLETAIAAARGRLDGGLQQQLDALLALRKGTPDVRHLANAVTTAREKVRAALANSRDDAGVRDLLFLDLALEELLRGTIERQNVSQLERDPLVDLVHLALRNLQFTVDVPEVALCAAHWAMLASRQRDGRDWALHAKSVADRMARWIQGFTSELYQRLQPKAEFLGTAFGVEPWTVPLFSEEVIRGGPAFAVALLLRHLDPILRKAAGLGGWQVISPARAAGRVRMANHLGDVQGKRFPEATVLLANGVSGNEEIPEEVRAVITLDSPDLVSHVAVRARNAGVLFATCLEPETYRRLQGQEGTSLALHVTPGGDVVFEEADPAEKLMERPTSQQQVIHPIRLASNVSPGGPWVITQDRFAPGVVGGKANNLNGLRGKLPDWISFPVSLALPFGVLERALDDEANREVQNQATALIAASEPDPTEILPRLRDLLLKIAPPPALRQELAEISQRVGLPPVAEEPMWHAIRRVWASQWNDRAYLSRRARGVAHDSLRMAVLIQQLVPADYAYVIHTVNPITGNRDEVFAEVVLGLGETLVGNYPGRAFGFTCRKNDLSIEVLSYPGKSTGLYGKGVIFRSDSNGEDLEGFAGAGLYDSYLAEEPEQRNLDYTQERLVWDHAFRDDLFRSIARVGIEVEKVLGSPQDIEGAVAGGRFFVVQTRPQVGLEQSPS